MIQQSCVNWGQYGCEYFNVRDYDWKDGSTIYLVRERYTDSEHTNREFTDIYYYLCESDYLNIVKEQPNYFIEAEKILYHKGMDLDKNLKFASTAKRFVDLRHEREVVDQNLQTLRFDVKKLEQQRDLLESISDEDFERLKKEFNENPIHQNSLKANNWSRNKRIELLNSLIEKIDE